MATAHAVGLEVIAVDSEDRASLELFRRDDDRGVDEIHWAVGVGLHQLERAHKRGTIEIPYGRALFLAMKSRKRPQPTL